MKEWYLSLSERDRKFLTIGGGLAVLLLGYFLLWDPLASSVARQSTLLKAKQDTHQQMEQWAEEARKLRTLNPGRVDTSNRSLISLVDEKIRAMGMKSGLDRMEPEGQDQVRLWLKNTQFDLIINLLGQLQQQYGINVESASITLADQPGMANAKLNLTRS
jgi:general secretion pathway protein M